MANFVECRICLSAGDSASFVSMFSDGEKLAKLFTEVSNLPLPRESYPALVCQWCASGLEVAATMKALCFKSLIHFTKLSTVASPMDPRSAPIFPTRTSTRATFIRNLNFCAQSNPVNIQLQPYIKEELSVHGVALSSGPSNPTNISSVTDLKEYKDCDENRVEISSDLSNISYKTSLETASGEDVALGSDDEIKVILASRNLEYSTRFAIDSRSEEISLPETNSRISISKCDETTDASISCTISSSIWNLTSSSESSKKFIPRRVHFASYDAQLPSSSKADLTSSEDSRGNQVELSHKKPQKINVDTTDDGEVKKKFGGKQSSAAGTTSYTPVTKEFFFAVPKPKPKPNQPTTQSNLGSNYNPNNVATVKARSRAAKKEPLRTENLVKNMENLGICLRPAKCPRSSDLGVSCSGMSSMLEDTAVSMWLPPKKKIKVTCGKKRAKFMEFSFDVPDAVVKAAVHKEFGAKAVFEDVSSNSDDSD